MKTTRRKFIKRGFWAALAAFFVPSVFDGDKLIASPNPLNYKPEPENWSDNEINIAWIGHSTILINFYGKIILTDPVLMERVGVYFLGASIGPSRLTPPALSLEGNSQTRSYTSFTRTYGSYGLPDAASNYRTIPERD